MSNTKLKILGQASRHGATGVTAIELVRAFYASSQQPLKKAKTMFTHCRELANRGMLTERGGSSSYRYTELRFVLTRNGYQEVDNALNRPRGNFPGVILFGGPNDYR